MPRPVVLFWIGMVCGRLAMQTPHPPLAVVIIATIAAFACCGALFGVLYGVVRTGSPWLSCLRPERRVMS